MMTNDTHMEAFAFALRYPPEKNGRGKRRRAKGEETIASYVWVASRFLKFLAGDEVSQESAGSFVRYLEKIGNSASSIARHIYALRAYFEFLDMELELGPPIIKKRLPRWLTQEEWQSLLEYAERPLWNSQSTDFAKVRALFHRAALFVYGGAGLRLSEGCNLRRDEVDPRGYLRVVRKGGEEQIVPVEDAVITAIQEWVYTHDSPWVFPGRNDSHLSTRRMQAVVRKLEIDAGLKDVRRAVHTLRHTVGSHLRALGADIRDIQEVLGHKDIGTTQIYTQMATEDLRKKLPKRFVSHQQGKLV